jgi:hypothetical protein
LKWPKLFSRKCRRTALHYIKKKKGGEIPITTHTTPPPNKSTYAPVKTKRWPKLLVKTNFRNCIRIETTSFTFLYLYILMFKEYEISPHRKQFLILQLSYYSHLQIRSARWPNAWGKLNQKLCRENCTYDFENLNVEFLLSKIHYLYQSIKIVESTKSLLYFVKSRLAFKVFKILLGLVLFRTLSKNDS